MLSVCVAGDFVNTFHQPLQILVVHPRLVLAVRFNLKSRITPERPADYTCCTDGVRVVVLCCVRGLHIIRKCAAGHLLIYLFNLDRKSTSHVTSDSGLGIEFATDPLY